MIHYLLSRIGCMMLIFGSMALVVGIAAESSGQPALNFLSIGLLLAFFGFLLWHRFKQRKKDEPRSVQRRKRRGREVGKGQDRNDGWE